MATKKEIVEMKAIELKTVRIRIEGDSPLIMHAWSEKAKRMMLDAQMGKKAGKKKEPKSPARDFVDSLYWLEGKPTIPNDATEDEVMQLYYDAIDAGARFGFPSTGLKQAAISAVYSMGWSKDKVSWRGAFFIEGEMLEIKSDTPEIREDMVRVGMGTADIRYRGQLNNWSTEFNLTYNVNGQYDLDAIVTAINAGGLLCGIGEWRPEKDGDFGRFHVAF